MRLLFLLFLSLCVYCVSAQTEIKNYVEHNAVAIKIISPDSTNFDDLEAIGNAIGDAKIVMLGEQDHGDAPTFLAKTRLIKYLHEKKGFNVLAFESDFFGLNEGWDELNKNEDSIRSFLRGNIFGVWTACNTCSNLLYHYIPDTYKTKTPLIITGFDCQVFLDYSMHHLLPELDSVLKKLNLPITQSADYASMIFPLLDTFNHLIGLRADTSFYNKRGMYLSAIKEQLKQNLSGNNFWIMVVENLIRENIQLEYSKTDYWKSINARDRQMALNLKWLSDVKYPNEKIIVWAHNYHISKFSGHFDARFLKEQISMGSIFTSDLSELNKTYIIGFTSHEGTAGRIGNKMYNVEKPNANSFENWINKNYDYAFIDFKKYNQLHPNTNEIFFMQGSLTGNIFHKNFKAQWNKIFDGMFYIKEMYPCKLNDENR